MYVIDPKFYYPIHHCRPRFKDDLEGVLFYISEQIASIPRLDRDQFSERLREIIWRYKDNSSLKRKTIDNWRTEISALLSFIQYSSDYKLCWPSTRAIELAEEQDTVAFFKRFITTFEYPGGYLKDHEYISMIEAGIRFKPLYFILDLLLHLERTGAEEAYITNAELTHIVFNDLRVTTGEKTIQDVSDVLISNRAKRETYDTRGDVTRYAGDFLDYMHFGNILLTENSKYYINNEEREFVAETLSHRFVFNTNERVSEIVAHEGSTLRYIWAEYTNQSLDYMDFRTDAQAFHEPAHEILDRVVTVVGSGGGAKSKEIGEFGEQIVLEFEKNKLKNAGLHDLADRVVKIPDIHGVGYDIESFEVYSKEKIYIEVKTSISMKTLEIRGFQMRNYQWRAAESYKSRYYVYRLVISKSKRMMYVIPDPIALYKSGKLSINPDQGLEVIFYPAIREISTFDV